MSSDIEVLLTPMTAEEIWASILSVASTVGLEVDNWKPLDPSRQWFEVTARLFQTRMGVEADANKGGFLDDAGGVWLDALVSNNYCDANGDPIERIEATFASGEVTFTNGGAGVFDYLVGEVTVQNSTTGKTYRNTEEIHLIAGTVQAVDFLADEAGAASTSGAGTIDTILSPAMIGVSVSNAAALIGVDEESDDDLRERARDSLGALSPNGPQSAYEYVAKSTLRTDGSTVAINRARPTASGNVVSVVLASPTGAPIVGDVTLVDDAIQSQCVPLGVTCSSVAAAVEVTVNVTATIYIPSDCPTTDAELEAKADAALEDYFPSYPIGGRCTVPGGPGFLFVALLRGIVIAADENIFALTMAAPAADVALADNEVAVLGTTTWTITRVAQS